MKTKRALLRTASVFALSAALTQALVSPATADNSIPSVPLPGSQNPSPNSPTPKPSTPPTGTNTPVIAPKAISASAPTLLTTTSTKRFQSPILVPADGIYLFSGSAPCISATCSTSPSASLVLRNSLGKSVPLGCVRDCTWSTSSVRVFTDRPSSVGVELKAGRYDLLVTGSRPFTLQTIPVPVAANLTSSSVVDIPQVSATSPAAIVVSTKTPTSLSFSFPTTTGDYPDVNMSATVLATDRSHFVGTSTSGYSYHPVISGRRVLIVNRATPEPYPTRLAVELRPLAELKLGTPFTLTPSVNSGGFYALDFAAFDINLRSAAPVALTGSGRDSRLFLLTRSGTSSKWTALAPGAKLPSGKQRIGVEFSSNVPMVRTLVTPELITLTAAKPRWSGKVTNGVPLLVRYETSGSRSLTATAQFSAQTGSALIDIDGYLSFGDLSTGAPITVERLIFPSQGRQLQAVARFVGSDAEVTLKLVKG